MTLDDLRFQVYQRMRMDDTASGDDETFVTAALNQGVREVLLRTHCYVVCADMATIADTWKYRMPTSVLALKRVLADDSAGTALEAVEVSDDDIFELRRYSTPTSADVRNRYALMGSDLLLLWPTPTANGTMDVFYVPKPAEMSDGSHDPADAAYGGIQVQYHPAIYLWALAQAADKEQHSVSQGGVKYDAAFEQEIMRIKKDLNRRKGRNLAPASLHRSSRSVPVSRGVDLG